MSDIVERLRACDGIKSGDPDCCCKEAADEIARLRAALREIADTHSTLGLKMHSIARAALEGKP